MLDGRGTVDGFGGPGEFFIERQLRGKPLPDFAFAHSPGEQTGELLFGAAPGDDQAFEMAGETGFDEQRCFDENRVANAGALPLFELAEHDLFHGRMKNGVELSELAGIGKDDGSEPGAIDAAGGVGEVRAKFAKNFLVSGLAGLDEFVGYGIRIENRKTHFAQHSGDGALAAGDATG